MSRTNFHGPKDVLDIKVTLHLWSVPKLYRFTIIFKKQINKCDYQLMYPIAGLEGSSVAPSPEVIKLSSCSTQLRMKFVLLIYIQITNNCKLFLAKYSEA